MGYKVVLDESNPKHADLAAWLRSGASGRQFHEMKEVEGLATFVFPAGQNCFRPHHNGVGRQPIMIRTVGGDRRTFSRPQDWHESYNEEAERLKGG